MSSRIFCAVVVTIHGPKTLAIEPALHVPERRRPTVGRMKDGSGFYEAFCLLTSLTAFKNKWLEYES